MSQERLLIIEDENSVARQLKWFFGKFYDVSIATDAGKARQKLSGGAYPIALLDLGLPPSPDTPREGLKLLEEMGGLSPHTKVIVVTGNSEKDVALKAVGTGAVDFCTKPINLNTLQIILSRAYGMHALEEENRRLFEASDPDEVLCGMIGISPVMQDTFSHIKRISATDYPILIAGESGTGKEMAANAIHHLGARRKRPFVIINCGAIPENLLESELFGHERGAFTGAFARKTGKLELADSGTVFLDEISELPLSMQVKILRVLQEGTIERIGGNGMLSLNVRVIAATNVDLEKAVACGAFREDLFYRLNVVPVHLPALKERPEDIQVLAHHFLGIETQKLKAGRTAFSPGAVAALTAHDWPGNVRELQNRIRRGLSVCKNQTITPIDLGLEAIKEKPTERVHTLQQARDRAEQSCIRQALLMTGNNISQAAKLLETSRPTLHDLLKKHGTKLCKGG